MEKIISFSNKNGLILLPYANCPNCELLKEFQIEVGEFETIKVEIHDAEYDTELAYLDVAKYLWRILGDIPTDENGVDGNIDEDFIHFEKGEPVYDIWHWFQETFNISVVEDLM